jgi:acetylornithine aminotransferase/acetylornithine/N-succinyldiaminopimelate aminotransferase
MKTQRKAVGSKRSAPDAASAALRDTARYLMNTYQRPPVVFTRGQGCYLYDSRGKKYLDFVGGLAVNALGHAHPRLVRVVQREAARMIHLSNLYNHPYQGPLARKLATWSGMDRVFFCNSGTEAIEGALKLARLSARKRGAANKTRILALENSFHGRTMGAVSITHTPKYREPFEPLIPGVEFVRVNDVADLAAKFDDTVCALVVEAMQGEGGIQPLSGPFWTRARELTAQYGAALVADEIQCGLGRTGRPFGYQRYMGLPDIVVVAKPLAGGLPLGAFMARETFAEALTPGMHGSTFGGGPLTCAVALEFLATIEEENLLENVRERGTQIRAGLSRLSAQFDFIRDVRGEGLMIGAELAVEGRPYVATALKHNLLINCTQDRVLRFLPAFIVSEKQVEDFLKRLAVVLAETRRPAVKTAASEADSPRALAASR